METLSQLIKDQASNLLADYEYLHQYPELSSQEVETAAWLKAQIEPLGVTIEQVSKTGFVAIMEMDQPGPAIGLRTDIDGLPIQEAPRNLKHPRQIISQNDGVMHACGHDGHMSVLLGAMRVLASLKAELKGTIYFIFEEAEETGEAISHYMDYFQDKELRVIYGNHLYAELPIGQIIVNQGPVMAASHTFNIEVKGRGGHIARPDLSVSPIVCVSQIITALNVAWNTQVPVDQPVTLGFGQVHSGAANNVIPDIAKLGGSLRFFNMEAGNQALAVMKRVVDSVCQLHQCDYDFSLEEGATTPVVNDSNFASLAQQIVDQEMEEQLVTDQLWFASETFSAYNEVAPTVFTLIGFNNPAKGTGAAHHNEYFELDPDCLLPALTLMTCFAVHALMDEQG